MTKQREAGTIEAAPLTADAFAPFGHVIEARAELASVDANMKSARRFDRLAPLENLRREDARPNLCLFRCTPAPAGPFQVKLLERHPFSTQVFLPMLGVTRYLVVVARGGENPELATLHAFIARGAQGVAYAPGVWHHPLVALDQESDFACLVWEDGTAGDCEVQKLAQPVQILIS